MYNRTLNLDRFTDSIAGIIKYNAEYFCDKNEYSKITEILERAINGELTEKQKECLSLYYEKKMRISDIAQYLDVCPSTVSRHLVRARKKLQHIIGYYYPKLLI